MTNNHIQTDILIVGAGPPAQPPLFLSKMGIPHIIVDAAKFPRDKICGDGLDLKVFRVLQHLDPAITVSEVFDNQDFLQSWGARIITPNGRATEFVQPEPAAGEPLRSVLWTAKRLHFDQFLVKKIDSRFANFLPETKVEKIERDGNAWRVQAKKSNGEELEISTRLLIGADGDHSVVLRSIGERGIERRHYAGTLRQYWRGVGGLHPKNLIEVYLPKGMPLSYFYIFPLPNGEANVGYGMVSELIAKNKYNLKDLFKKLLYEDPLHGAAFSGCGTPGRTHRLGYTAGFPAAEKFWRRLSVGWRRRFFGMSYQRRRHRNGYDFGLYRRTFCAESLDIQTF
ncbi:MAG: FAD-dependent monooxygenase [Lewinellaceae bacterium]|nr:FAD-dependent monooxygenase [Lewinellaceae bacterium]